MENLLLPIRGQHKALIQFVFLLILSASTVHRSYGQVYDATGDDHLNTVIETANGEYLLVGASASSDNGDKTEKNRGIPQEISYWDTLYSTFDYWIIKKDATSKKLWDKTFGGEGDDIPVAALQTTGGALLIAGYSNSGSSGDKTQDNRGDHDYWVVKTDASGNKLWDKTFGGNRSDQLNFVLATPDGGYLLAGNSFSDKSGEKSEDNRGLPTLDENGNPVWSSDLWIVKIDANGQKLWDKTYGGDKEENLITILATTDGGYLLGGQSFSGKNGDKSEESRGESDFWLIKVDASGQKLWNKTMGGDKADDLQTLIPVPDGGYLLAGNSYSGKSGEKSQENRGGWDYWMIKVDTNGDKVWDKTYGGERDDYFSSAIVAENGGYILGGTSNSSISGDRSVQNESGYYPDYEPFFDYWIIKTDASGNKLWDKAFGRGSLYSNYLISVLAAPNGGYLLTGWTTDNDMFYGLSNGRVQNGDPWGSYFFVVKINPEGQPLWGNAYDILDFSYGHYSVLNSAWVTRDGGYLLAGNGSAGPSGNSSIAYVVVKVDPDILPSSIQINFQNRWARPPQGWLKDYGLPFAEKAVADSTLTYGWKRRDTSEPINLSVGGSFPGNEGNGRHRPLPADVLLATLLHMQGDDVKNFRGTPIESYWELAVENGEYLITVSVGDGYRYTYSDPESHSINVEGIPAITNFVPQGSNGSLTRFEQATIKVTINDGLLTIDADGGTNAKINYAIIQPLGNTTSAITRKDPSSQETETQTQIRAFPNPFSDILEIETSLRGSVRVDVLDVVGNRYYQGTHQLETGELTLDLPAAQLKTGMYLLKLQAEDGTQQLTKVVKR